MEHIFPQMQCFRWISQWIIPIKEWDISLGGTEENAGVYYQEMLENAARYEGMEIRRMSRLTENLLEVIDYDGKT